MASITLTEAALLSEDMLISGIITNIVTVNPFFEILPFEGVEGTAITYNRENNLGKAQWLGVGGEITTGKDATTFTKISESLTTLIGDAEVSGFIQATQSNVNDQKAAQIAGKAKSLGRQYQDKMITGDVVAGSNTANEINGLLKLVTADQTITTDNVNGGPLTFDLIDQLIDKVLDKDGELDYIMMHSRTLRKYFSLLRALGGAGISETMALPSGKTIPTYRGIPLFQNNWIPIDQVKGTGADKSESCTSMFAGTIDDGTHKHGIAGLTAMRESGIVINDIGESHTRDESITRVKWYNGLALFNTLGLAMVKGLTT